jgi:pimeloyl-ACP methyl ester carboxylesterase
MTGNVITAEVDGNRLAYRRSGQGPALLLLHGFLCDSRVWRHQLAGLSDEFTGVAWDAPGAGASSDPPEPFTTAARPSSLRS